MLVPASNIETAGMLAEYSIKTASRLGANIIALYVLEKHSKNAERDALEVLDIFTRGGRAYNVNVVTLMEKGDPLTEIMNSIESRNIDVVVIGQSKKEGFGKWLSEDFASVIIQRTNVPVITMPSRPELMNN